MHSKNPKAKSKRRYHCLRMPATLTSQRTQSCPDIIIKPKNSFKIKYKKELNNHLNLPLTSFEDQTRAFLKIQDGCDGYCTYCIVPKTRPFVRSKPVEEVLCEAQTIVETGHREIVVTRIFLGAYGCQSVRQKNWPNQQNNHLTDLLDTLCQHPNNKPHLHLSLQSGSDNILRITCRQYRVEKFREKGFFHIMFRCIRCSGRPILSLLFPAKQMRTLSRLLILPGLSVLQRCTFSALAAQGHCRRRYARLYR